VCIKHLVFMPRPVVLFTWDGWWTDMECTFVGPSSLFQRWNLHIRNNYGLLNSDMFGKVSDTWNILIILRRIGSSRGRKGQSDELYTSRLISNENDVIQAMKTLPNVVVNAVDLSKLSFEAQVALMASTSILVGAHGAGITASMHMPVGTKRCCGVLEFYPPGEFIPIRGHGNMVRRMGLYYDRMDLPGASQTGMKIDTSQMLDRIRGIIDKIDRQPSCLVPDVLHDPFFNNYTI
jgi:hypothetical protein